MNNKKLIFIVSPPRSGSTLFLSYLCGIPNTKVLYETKLLSGIYQADTYTDGLEELADYFDSIEEEIVIEKTPEHSLHLEIINNLRQICKRDIYVIYIVRPPIPTIFSLIKASKDNPGLFGNMDLLGACETYEESLVSIYNNLVGRPPSRICKTNEPNTPTVKKYVYGRDILNDLVKISWYYHKTTISYSFCITYRELIYDSYSVLETLLSSLYVEVDIQSLIDNRITNTVKYLPIVSTEKHHVNVLRDTEEVEVERRSYITKQFIEGFSNTYIEKYNYIRNYFEHPITKNTIYDLIVNKKVLGVKENPEVYVLVSLYNKENYIKETLSSIANQTYKNIRVVVIDDASTDKSAEVAERFIESLSEELRDKFSLIRYDTNQGVSFIRNKGLSICTDIISFCDADDIWNSELVQKSVDTFIKYPYVDCVYSRVLHKREEVIEKDYSKVCNGSVFNDAIKFNFLTCGSNLFIKKEVVDKTNIQFDLAFSGCEDWDFLIQLSQVAMFKCTKEYLVTYRRLENSLSSNKKNQVDMGKTILKKYVKNTEEYSKTFTRLFLYYFSIKNFTWKNIKDLDFRFILEVIINKLKSYVKSCIS